MRESEGAEPGEARGVEQPGSITTRPRIVASSSSARISLYPSASYTLASPPAETKQPLVSCSSILFRKWSFTSLPPCASFTSIHVDPSHTIPDGHQLAWISTNDKKTLEKYFLSHSLNSSYIYRPELNSGRCFSLSSIRNWPKHFKHPTESFPKAQKLAMDQATKMTFPHPTAKSCVWVFELTFKPLGSGPPRRATGLLGIPHIRISSSCLST